MAWISVHDTIDGKKLRDLYKRLKCSKYEATGMLVYLWQWGLKNADKNGQIMFADKDDIEIFFQGNKNGCSIDPKDIVDALLETGWIDRTEDGTMYLHDWAVWQKEWYKYQERLSKDAERKRNANRLIRTAKKEEPIEEFPADKPTAIPPEIPQETPVEPSRKKTEPKKRNSIDYPKEFLKFWEVYPRTDKKAEAYECFLARLRDGTPSEKLIQAAEEYASKCKKQHTATQYIMLAKTFLGPHLCFMDYIPAEPKKYEETGGNPFDFYTEG